MTEATRDPVALAAARLEAAVEKLAESLTQSLARVRQDTAEDMVPRAEVQALADRLDATITRLRAAVAEELRGGEAAVPPGEAEED